MDKLKDGCEQVMDSDALRTMLQVCVQAGNVLNRGSFRGDAVAVDIGFLSQMKGMRANGSSLLDFICAQMQENSP